MGGELKNRIRFTTSVSNNNLETLRELANATRIPLSKLIDEALEDLFTKHGEALQKAIADNLTEELEDIDRRLRKED